MSSTDDILDAIDSAFRDPTVSPGAMRHVPPRDDEWDVVFDEPGSHLTWETARFDGNMLGYEHACTSCERCTWNPGPDCGLAEHPHCPRCGHCNGRHAPGQEWLLAEREDWSP